MLNAYYLPGSSENYCVNLSVLDNQIVAFGNFYHTLKLFNKNDHAEEITSKGEKDIFVACYADICDHFRINAGNDTILCEGGNVTLITPLEYSSYLWEPGGTINENLSVSAPGVYYLNVVSVEGCIGRDSLNVFSISPPEVHIGSDTLIAAGTDLSLEFANATDSNEYIWNTTGDGYFGNENNLTTYYAPSYNDLRRGSVTLSLTGFNFCGNNTDSLSLSFNQSNDGITAFPNPTAGLITLICTEGLSIVDVTILSQNGYVYLNRVPVDNFYFNYNMEDLVPGSYFFNISTNQGIITKVINKI